MALFAAYILTHVMVFSLKFYNYGAISTGVTSALFMWFGFVMPTQVTAQIFGEKKWKLLAIDTTHQLFSLMVMGIVLGLFMS